MVDMYNDRIAPKKALMLRRDAAEDAVLEKG
jgi:hypothetical protein